MEGWEQLTTLRTCWRYSQGMQDEDGGKSYGQATEFKAHVEQMKMINQPGGEAETPGYGFKLITDTEGAKLGDLIVVQDTPPSEQDLIRARGDSFQVSSIKQATSPAGQTFYIIEG